MENVLVAAIQLGNWLAQVGLEVFIANSASLCGASIFTLIKLTRPRVDETVNQITNDGNGCCSFESLVALLSGRCQSNDADTANKYGTQNDAKKADPQDPFKQ